MLHHCSIKRFCLLLFLLAFVQSNLISQTQIQTETTLELRSVKGSLEASYFDIHVALLSQLDHGKLKIYTDSNCSQLKPADSIWFTQKKISIKNGTCLFDSINVIRVDKYNVEQYQLHHQYVKIVMDAWYDHQVFGYIKRKDFDAFNNQQFLTQWFVDAKVNNILSKESFCQFMDSATAVVVNKFFDSDPSNQKFIIINASTQTYLEPYGFFFTYNKSNLKMGATAIANIDDVALKVMLDSETGFSDLTNKIPVKSLPKYFSPNEVAFIHYLFFYHL